MVEFVDYSLSLSMVAFGFTVEGYQPTFELGDV